jgi:large subunit ribosomal protein L29
MDTNEMREKSAQELNDHIAELRREQFSLRMQKAQQFARVRREIARAATILGEKQKTHGAA